MTFVGIASMDSSAIAPVDGGVSPLSQFAPSPQPTSLDFNQTLDEEIIAAVQQTNGTLIFDNGSLTSNVTSPLGDVIGTYNLVDLLGQLSVEFQELDGTLTVENGTIAGDLSTGDQLLTGSLQFSQLVGSALTDVVTNLSGTVPFANGAFEVEIPTALGTVSGTIGFGSGALVTDLTTPFGPVNFSVDFGDNAQIPFSINNAGNNIAAVLDLSNGFISFDLLPTSTGGEIQVPLTWLEGSITFANGQAAIALPTVFGDVNTTIDLVGLVETEVVPFLNSIAGTLTVNDGLLTADLTTPEGPFVGTIDGVALLAELSEIAAGTSGTIIIGDGLIVSDLTTPIGDLVGTIDLSQA